MTLVTTYLAVTLAAGFGARLLRLPPLGGFLAAGFVLSALGTQRVPELATLADLGVTLLLFAVGLKLDVRQLLRREVWGTAILHTSFMVIIGVGLLGVLTVLGVGLLAGLAWSTIALLAFALSFSSTVFVVKALAERSDTRARYGQVAVGVLVIQDLFAVVFVALSRGTPPSPWAQRCSCSSPAAAWPTPSSRAWATESYSSFSECSSPSCPVMRSSRPSGSRATSGHFYSAHF